MDYKGYDLLVQSGKNTIIAEWLNESFGGVDIYIDPNDFYEDKIDCSFFLLFRRQDQCNNVIINSFLSFFKIFSSDYK